MGEKPPATAEEAIEAYQRLRAKNEAKEDLHARISLSGGIEIDTVNKQVLRRSLYPKIEIDVPPDRADLLDALHRNQAILNILIGEFMAAGGVFEVSFALQRHCASHGLSHVPATSNVQDTPPISTTLKTDPVLEWIQSKNNPTVEFIPTDRPGAEQFRELATQRKDGYWLNQDATLIFRYKQV